MHTVPQRAEDGDRPSDGPPGHLEPIRTERHELVLFGEMKPMLRAVADEIDAAQERVWIETYIFRHDACGATFAEKMAAAVARGVDVRLLYDPLGCNKTDPAFFEKLRARGVDVRAYRPRAVQLRSGRWWPRDHSRNIVIDGRAFTGGAAWGVEWMPKSCGGHGWHDVCTSVRGPVVRDFARAFLRRWAEAVGDVPEPDDYVTGDKFRDVEFVSDSPAAGKHVVLERHRAAVRSARERVWLENAYFFPPAGLLQDLCDAAARGVDVRVIVPCETDLPILQRAARSEYHEWIDRGIKVYEYCRSILHAKFAVVDDDWATVGTFNANVTSLRYANEANLFVYDPAYAERAAWLFASDLAHCREVTHEMVSARPVLDQVKDALAHGALTALESGRAATR